MARSVEMENPEVRRLWRKTLFIRGALGFTNGLYLFTYGPYFYQKFGGAIHPATAMLLTTILLGIRQGLVALLEIPTGALADAIGRANVVILSWIIRSLFFIFLAVIWLCKTPTAAFAWGVLASILFALNYTFFNGAFSAWCVDTLREKAPHVSYGWLASRFYSYEFFADMLGGVLAVYLYVMQVPFFGFLLAGLVAFCVMGFCAKQMKEVHSVHFLDRHQVQLSTVTRRVGEIIGKSVQITTKSPVLFWIVFTFGNYMFLLNLVVYLWPVYFQSHAGGKEHYMRNWILIIIIAQMLRFVGSRALVVLNRRWSLHGGIHTHLSGFRRFFIGFAVASALIIISFSLETAKIWHVSFLFPAAVIVVQLAYGVIGPCFETLITAYIPAEDASHRATIMSTGSMFRSLLILLLAIPSGGTSGENSPIYWAIPASLLLVAAVSANYFMKRANHHLPVVDPETLNVKA